MKKFLAAALTAVLLPAPALAHPLTTALRNGCLPLGYAWTYSDLTEDSTWYGEPADWSDLDLFSVKEEN